MTFYITHEDRNKVKKSFLNIRKQIILSTDDIIASMGYKKEEMSEYAGFIVSEEMKKAILKYSSSKKKNSIVYSNPMMDAAIAKTLLLFLEEHTPIQRVVFLTEKGKYEEYYELFDEVVFFPSIRKVRLIECVPIPTASLRDEEVIVTEE